MCFFLPRMYVRDAYCVDFYELDKNGNKTV